MSVTLFHVHLAYNTAGQRISMVSTKWHFDSTAHARFARISGDYNPMHTDAIAARRTYAGTVVVHGMHALLRALDLICTTTEISVGTKGLRVQLLRPIYVGDTVDLQIAQTASNLIRARLGVDGEDVVTITLGPSITPAPSLPPMGSFDGPMPVPNTPISRNLGDMRGVRGGVVLPSAADVATMFPTAAARLGLSVTAALAGCSSLVGMVVPGLHSMFCGLDVTLNEAEDLVRDFLQFQVSAVTERFRSVRIGISAPGIRGSLETIARLPPVAQPSVTEIRSTVIPGEFRGIQALVIGGSRGLGEVTAKLVAAGGGAVIITYTVGLEDAQNVAQGINAAGMSCSLLKYDVRADATEQLRALSSTPTHMFYFATPHIARRKRALFDSARFNELNKFYVDGFHDAATACLQYRPQGVEVFYPSTIYIESRPPSMAEYAMSKAAGEVVCAEMSKYMPGLRLTVRRLPRLLTDQTSSVVQSNVPNAADILLPIIRDMCDVGA